MWQLKEPPTDQQLQHHEERLPRNEEVGNNLSFMDAYHSTRRQFSNEEQEPQVGMQRGETQAEPRQVSGADTPPFSVTVSSMTAALVDIPNLQPNTQVVELCQKVAESCSLPLFAVRLLHQTQVLHMSWTGVSLEIGRAHV